MAAELIYTKEPVRVKIPMKPYVVKFLLKKFGKTHKASKTSWLGMSAINLLSRDYSKPIKLTTKSYFTVLIPYSICVKNGHFIDYNKFPEFEKMCEKIFTDFMYEHVQINSANGAHGEVMKAFRDFFKFYKISEDDLKLDTTYRLYMRHLETNVTKKNKQ